jgi:A/G-specific adenine glycosylase
MTSFSKPLLDWYTLNAREMPWRGISDPYAIWISEIMLQQTQVATVRPYYERWMARFPDVRALASAEQREVLTYWEGLGYYSRARNLHKAAQTVVADFGGQLPGSVEALRQLSGIGPYTAGAIASLAFGLDEPVVDGNVARLLSRLFDIELGIDSSAGQKRLWSLAREHLPPGEAADYNQGLMEFGSRVCRPRNPDCHRCPLQRHCLAFAAGHQLDRPVKKAKAKTPHYWVTAAIIRAGDQYLIAQRRLDGLLGGMWEFPGGKLEAGESLETCLAREIREELGAEITVGKPVGVYKHVYSHFKVTLHAFYCYLGKDQHLQKLGVADWTWVQLAQLSDYPMGKIDRSISQDLQSAPD